MSNMHFRLSMSKIVLLGPFYYIPYLKMCGLRSTDLWIRLVGQPCMAAQTGVHRPRGCRRAHVVVWMVPLYLDCVPPYICVHWLWLQDWICGSVMSGQLLGGSLCLSQVWDDYSCSSLIMCQYLSGKEGMARTKLFFSNHSLPEGKGFPRASNRFP